MQLQPTELKLTMHCPMRVGMTARTRSHPRSRQVVIWMLLPPVESDLMVVTVDQHKVREGVKALTGNATYTTHESVALAIALYCMSQFPLVAECSVTVGRHEHTLFKDDQGWFEFEVTQRVKRTG